MFVEIQGQARGQVSGQKVFLHGVSLQAQCPACAAVAAYDLGAHPLYQPPLGRPFGFQCTCAQCGARWVEDLLLELQVRPARQPAPPAGMWWEEPEIRAAG